MAGRPARQADELRRIRSEDEFIAAGDKGWWSRAGWVDEHDFALLRHCGRFATVSEHADELCRVYSLDGAARPGLIAALEDLAGRNLLLSDAELCPDAEPETDSDITTLSILTCNRPEALQRALRSWGAATADRQQRLIIADDGDDARQAKAGLGMTACWLHRRHRARWLESLPIDWRGPAAWGLGLSHADEARMTVGANTNAVLLATTGEKLASFDDDLCLPVGRAPEWRPDAVCLAGEADPTQLLIFDDEDAVDRALVASRAHPSDLHAAVLGKPVGQWLQKEGTEMSSDLKSSHARAWARGGRVRLSMLGLAGDSGMSSPTWYLGLAGQAGERLDANYEVRLTSRQVLRASDRLRLASSAFYMSSAVALDNRALLPPYMPFDRNADGLFGLCVRRICADSFTAFLPYAVRHRPPGTRSYRREDLWNIIRSPSINESLMAAVGQWEPGPYCTSAVARCRSLGAAIEGMAQQSVGMFRRWQSEVAVRRDFQRLRWLETLLEDTAAHRHPDIREGIQRTEARLAQAGEPFLGPRGQVDYQETMAAFGRWLQLWPELVAQTRSNPLVGEDWVI